MRSMAPLPAEVRYVVRPGFWSVLA